MESDAYCRQVIAARMQDGYADPGPIFGDITTVWKSNIINEQVDGLIGGFPCQAGYHTPVFAFANSLPSGGEPGGQALGHVG